MRSRSIVYKELRPQQILKSEENVQRVQNIIENEYSNPFSFMDECEKRNLFHLSSGVPLQDKITDEILNTFCKGQVYTSYFGKKGSCYVKNCFMPLFKGTILCHSGKSQQSAL